MLHHAAVTDNKAAKIHFQLMTSICSVTCNVVAMFMQCLQMKLESMLQLMFLWGEHGPDDNNWISLYGV